MNEHTREARKDCSSANFLQSLLLKVNDSFDLWHSPRHVRRTSSGSAVSLWQVIATGWVGGRKEELATLKILTIGQMFLHNAYNPV